MKLHRRIFAIVATTVVVIVAFGLIATWPPVAQEEELTGLSYKMDQIAFFDDTGIRGEGHRIWIYRIPDDAAQRLAAVDYELSEYPMWSAHAFDGYEQLHWTASVGAANPAATFVLRSLFSGEHRNAINFDDVKTLDDARQFAHSLTLVDGTLVAGWYVVADADASVATNYFAYVLNLDERLLVKLSLLT
ncbi:MAG: hypothetical protein ACKVHE_19280 [Planctomycetales bacterium]|jgi:hypothetical protein